MGRNAKQLGKDNLDEKIEVQLYNPHYYQRLVHYYADNSNQTTFIVACAGRQSGKSHAAKFCLLQWALSCNDARIMWCTFSLQQTYKDYMEVVDELTRQGLVMRKNGSITGLYVQLVNNTIIYFRATNQKNTLRGFTLTHLILDEAAFSDEETYSMILLPMLNTQRPGVKSKILLASTPRGKQNWFYQIYNQAKNCEDGSMVAIKWTSYDNPMKNESILQMWKDSMPDEQYRQEILGEWIDQYCLFNGAADCAVLPKCQEEPIPGQRVFMSIDVGMMKDYTCLSIMNQKCEVIYITRYRRMSAPQLKQYTVDLIKKWQPFKIIIEKNGIGLPFISDLKNDYGIYNIEEWTTNNTTKQEIINALANAISKKEIKFPKEPKFLLDELLDFTAIPTVNGSFKFQGGLGHDDGVMSVAMLYQLYSRYKTSRYTLRF